MKTQVIQLERHDDVTSVKDKIAWNKASRVLLVWPRRGRMLYRPLDLLLLQRACQAEGAQLACVADDDDILDHAKDLGIPVFRSAKVAERLPWRRQRQKKSFDPKPLQAYGEFESFRKTIRPTQPSWQQQQWVRLTALCVGIAAIFLLVGAVAPEARISLTFKHDIQQMDIPVYASPDLPGLNPTGGLPVTFINVIVEGQDSQPASGTMIIPETVAFGQVQFANLTDQAVTIPTGMIVQTTIDPVIQYETVRELFLPAKPGATVEGKVQAKQAGSNGNLPPRTIKAVSGPLGARLGVTNLTEISGGRDLITPTGTKQDTDVLRERLLEKLKQLAIEEINKKSIQGSRKFDQTLELVHVIEEKLTPAAGFPADQLDLNMRVEFRVWTVRESDLRAICLTVLDANLPGDRLPLNSTITIEDSGPGDQVQNQFRWQVHVTRQMLSGWNEALLIKAVAGRQVEDGKKNISQMLNLISPAEIVLSPSWWPVIPLLPGRIMVVLQ